MGLAPRDQLHTTQGYIILLPSENAWSFDIICISRSSSSTSYSLTDNSSARTIASGENNQPRFDWLCSFVDRNRRQQASPLYAVRARRHFTMTFTADSFPSTVSSIFDQYSHKILSCFWEVYTSQTSAKISLRSISKDIRGHAIQPFSANVFCKIIQNVGMA